MISEGIHAYSRKQLIVNADDFGLTEEINKGIIRCYQEGILRSASILANGIAFEDAVLLARENKGLGIGVHLCLVEERPVLSAEEISSLIDENGCFPKNYIKFLIKFCFKKIKPLDIEKEFDAQIKKVICAQVRPTHLDSHQHIHMIPSIFNIVLKLAKKYDIKSIRLVQSGECYLCRLFLCFFAFHNKKKLKKNNMSYPEYFLGFDNRGNLNYSILGRWLRNLNFGTTEIMCHPGYKSTTDRYSHWNFHWEEEMFMLIKPELKRLIKDLDVELVNHAS